MATTAVHVYLGTFQVDTTGSGSWQDLLQLTKFKPPQMKIGDAKTTYLTQANPFHTYIPGWGEPGAVTWSGNMITATYSTLFTYFTTRLVKNFRVRYNDGSSSTSGSVLSFTGYINELGDDELSRDQEAPVMTAGSVKVSGLPTYSSAT